MRKIIIRIIIAALILTAFGTLSALHARADSTSEVNVVSYSWYVATSNNTQATYIGDLIAVGEIQNVGSNTIDYVILSGIAYDSNGQVLASVSAPAYLNYILPDQKNPFYLDFTPQYSVTQNQSYVDHVGNVKVAVSSVRDTTDTPFSGLAIPTGGVSGYLDDAGTYTVVGTVQNNGHQTAKNVWAVTTFYDTSGKVVALNYTYLSNALAPAEPVRFTATPIDNTAELSSQIANYSVLMKANPIATVVTPSPALHSSPTNSQQPAQSAALPSWLINVVLVAIIIVLVVIIALLLLKKRDKNTQSVKAP